MVIRKYKPKDAVIKITDKDGEEHTLEGYADGSWTTVVDDGERGVFISEDGDEV